MLLLLDDAALGADISFNGPMLAMPYSLQRLGFTYVRNSLKTVYQGGSLVTLAANQFGTTYDSVTGLHGFEAEPAATNLATNSAGAAATWTVSNVTDAGTPISGFAASLAFGDNSVLRTAYKAISHTSGTTYSIAIYVQMDDGLAPVLGLTVATGDFYLASDGGGICTSNPLVVSVGNGLYRVSAARTATTTAAGLFGVVKLTTQSARTFRIVGIQVETGTRATSYIATAGSTVTRAADVLSCAVANIPGFSAAGYTLVCDSRQDGVVISPFNIINLNDGTINNRALIRTTGSTGIQTVVSSGGVVSANVTESNPGVARVKAAHSVSVNSFLRAVNGVAGTADTLGPMAIGLTSLHIGHELGVNQLNGYIYRVRLIPTALNQAQTTAQTS